MGAFLFVRDHGLYDAVTQVVKVHFPCKSIFHMGMEDHGPEPSPGQASGRPPLDTFWRPKLQSSHF